MGIRLIPLDNMRKNFLELLSEEFKKLSPDDYPMAMIIGGTGSSRAREFHPHPLTEPCVKVSPHTALNTLCFVHMLLSSYPPLCLRVV